MGQQQSTSAPAPAAAPARAPTSTPASARGPAAPPEISLAAALFGFPAAAGFYVPTKEGIPEPWRGDFIARYADAAVLLRLFQSCRTGRDWVMEAARTARLTLHMTAQQVQSCGWFRQLTAAQAALTTRGGHATALTVYCDLDYDQLPHSTEQAAGQCLIGFLVESGKYVSELSLHYVYRPYDDPYAPEFQRALVQRAAAGLSNITSLQVLHCDTRLPPPEQLPQLRKLTSTCTSESKDYYRRVRAYIPTLTHLTCDHHDYSAIPTYAVMDMLRPQSSLSHTLTQLSGNIELNTVLLGLILDRLPTLRRLDVKEVLVASDRHAAREWGVEHIQMGVFGAHSQANIDRRLLNTLTRLPQFTGDRTCFEVPGCMDLRFETAQVREPGNARMCVQRWHPVPARRCACASPRVYTQHLQLAEKSNRGRACVADMTAQLVLTDPVCHLLWFPGTAGFCPTCTGPP